MPGAIPPEDLPETTVLSHGCLSGQMTESGNVGDALGVNSLL